MSVANPNIYGPGAGNKEEERLKRLAATGGILVAAILIVAKLIAFFMTHSVSLLSSLMDSGFDVIASVLTLVSIAQAASPADHEHRFGHGKIEAVGALAQALFLAGSAVFLVVESVRRILHPQMLEDPGIGLGVMALSMALTYLLVLYQKKVIAKTNSVAVAANYLNYYGDLMMNAGVMLALGLTYITQWSYFDPIFALGIAARLLWGTYKVAVDSFDILLDKELPDRDRAMILDLAGFHDAVHGVHDLRTRNTGERMMISFHIELDPEMSIRAVHDVMDEIEEALHQAFPKAEVFIHPEPAGLDDHRLDNVIRK